MDEDTGRFLYPAEAFEKTPSISDGYTSHQELMYRQRLAMLMQNIGSKSNLSQLAVNTSVIYMHRFFMYRSIKKVTRVHLAIAFVFAAGKVEESARKLEHLIRTAVDIIRYSKNRDFIEKGDENCYHTEGDHRRRMDPLCGSGNATEPSLFACHCEQQRRPGYNGKPVCQSPNEKAFMDMRKLILDYEIEIYSTIGFHLQVVHPHNYVIRMCAMLGGKAREEECSENDQIPVVKKAENIKDISQYAYNLATASSQLTVMCLKYKPDLIATVCLNIASIAHCIRFMNMKDQTHHWYQVHDPTMEVTVLESVTEEFMNVIKDCALLPTWMTSLSRGGRPAAPVSKPSSSASSSQGNGQPPASSSSSQRVGPSGYDASGQHSSSSSHGQGRGMAPSAEGGAFAAGGDHPSSSQGHRSGSGQHGRPHGPPSATAGSMSGMRPPPSSSSSRSHGGPQHHPSQQQQLPPHHRSQKPHAGNNNNGTTHHSSRQMPPGSAPPGVMPPQGSSSSSRQLQQSRPPSSGHSASGRPSSQYHPGPPHSGQQPSHSTSQPQQQQQQHPPRSHDPSRPRGPHDQHRSSHDPSRSSHGLPRAADHRRPDPMSDSRRAPPSHPQSMQQRDDHLSHERPPSTQTAAAMLPPLAGGKSPHTPPTDPPPSPPPPQAFRPHSPPAVRPPSPPEATGTNLPQAGDAPDMSSHLAAFTEGRTQSPEVGGAPGRSQKLPPAQGPKISLASYRDRARSKALATSLDQSGQVSAPPTDRDVAQPPPTSAYPGAAMLENISAESSDRSATNSPADVSSRVPRLSASGGAGDVSSPFSVPVDSPNPRNKIKLKRDPATGERHAVKYTDSGLKIKIKPIRSDPPVSIPEETAGPSGSSSRSSTPREEGEIVDDSVAPTLTSTPGGSQRKPEGSSGGGLRIRLPVPKSSESGRGRDVEMNGAGSDRDSSSSSSGHHHHHKSHHHKSHHHHNKSKKHSSKHSSSRHEGKSSKRSSSSAVDYYDERPSKQARTGSVAASSYPSSLGPAPSATMGLQEAQRLGMYPDMNSSAGGHPHHPPPHHQNSGFSINDAFTSTLPSNIFDDSDEEEDNSHGFPPVTPTTDVPNPPHHERFHQLMAQHRARMDAKKPPLPPMPNLKGPPPPPPPPPATPPPPPPSL
ncbi:cyclin-T1 isoform X2 [Aplysia californica]|uniref:Cyclin-T1 isoform X2 n=1 Tax=Aplysia californica TaxID=6500 RepID=A0ABM1W4G3_APLCA|nr:cyclin-T1 isoform X2 [Aplysia californica]